MHCSNTFDDGTTWSHVKAVKFVEINELDTEGSDVALLVIPMFGT